MNAAYQLLRAVLCVLWPPVALAASQVTLDATFDHISPSVWVLLFVVATMGGLTSLLHRLKTEIPPRMLLYVASHMVMAWFAGFMFFVGCELADIPDLAEILIVGIASYSGARAVDSLSDRVAKLVDDKLSKIFG